MILHTEKTNALIGKIHCVSQDGDGPHDFYATIRTRSGDEFLDSITASDLQDAVHALNAGLRSGNFDKYRAQQRWLAHVENDTLDLY